MKKMIMVVMALGMALAIYSLRETSAEENVKDLFEKKCSICHPSDRPKSQKKSKADWEKTVMRMKDVRKAPISEGEAKLIIEYLAEHYGK